MAEKDNILDAYMYQQQKQTVDLSRIVRVGIIGTGWIAEAHALSYLACPDVEIVALSDLIPGKAEAFAEKVGIENARCFGIHTELLEQLDELNLDAVSICTYNSQHAPVAIDCLKAGLDVLLEKPMTVTLDEAIDTVRAEKASGRLLSIGFQPRLDPNMQMIRKIVQSGTLGDVYYVQTGGGRRHGIPTPFGTSFIEADKGGLGALADIGCYSLDMVLNALDYPRPLSVSGYKSDFFGKNPEYFTNDGKPADYAELFGVDDFAAAFIRLEGGIVIDFRIAWAMHMDTSGDTLILGTKGGLRIPSTPDWNGSIGGPMTIYSNIAGEDVETLIPVIESEEDLFYLKIRAFIDAVKERGEAPVPTSQILYNQAIISAIAESSDLGHEIKIEIPQI